jgi:hypothetical protein
LFFLCGYFSFIKTKVFNKGTKRHKVYNAK